MIWFGWVLWHINHCRLSNTKSSLYIYIKYIWFGLVGFYGISTLLVYLMVNPLDSYMLNISDLVWLGLWHINHCRLYNAKSSLYIYIKYIWFFWVECNGIFIYLFIAKSTLYIYIIYIRCSPVVFLYHIKHYSLFNTKSNFYRYQIMPSRLWLLNTLNATLHRSKTPPQWVSLIWH